ncbi:hypothetical protein EQP49_10800 [Yersinia sp. 2105 StPb PI]|nr:hypothetical protein CBW53_09775 [Yersinia frederiksenii]RXA96074.1 hypothetical protein EQP49_10800 [Yersinia sp. 2105 StPb PI]
MFYIPVRLPQFFDLNQSFKRGDNHVTGKFLFYINFIKSVHRNYFCKFSTFFMLIEQKTTIASQTQV